LVLWWRKGIEPVPEATLLSRAAQKPKARLEMGAPFSFLTMRGLEGAGLGGGGAATLPQ